jgi:hypothetical protein
MRAASRSMLSGPAGAAPSAQACSRTLASADHSPAIPRGSADSSSARMRQAVGTEATLPNSSGWSRRVARSLTQSPPSASMATRSRSTWPRSWAPARTPRLARRPSSAVSPSRSASSPSSAAPTWLQMPWPSATTSNRGRVLVACTCRVTLLVGGCDRQTAASSLVGRVPCYRVPVRSTATRNGRAKTNEPRRLFHLRDQLVLQHLHGCAVSTWVDLRAPAFPRNVRFIWG